MKLIAVGTVNTTKHQNDEYKEYALLYIAEYMQRIGVKEWAIEGWQPVVWYDRMIRMIPYKWKLNDRNRFIFDLVGGFRPCCEYVFSKLDENNIEYKSLRS